MDEVVNRDENGEGTALLVPHVRSTVDLRKPYFSASLAVTSGQSPPTHEMQCREQIPSVCKI